MFNFTKKDPDKIFSISQKEDPEPLRIVFFFFLNPATITTKNCGHLFNITQKI